MEDGYVAVSLVCAHLPIVISRAVAVSETGGVGEAVAAVAEEVVGLRIVEDVGLLIVEDVEDADLGAVLFEEPLTEET